MYRKFEGALGCVTLAELKQLFFEKYYDQGHSADERTDDVKRFLAEQSNYFFEDYCSYQFLAKTPSDQVMAENDSVCHFMDVLAGYVIAGESETYPFEKDLFAINI